MQNKLNEILELCIEKSGEKIFYEFKYNPKYNTISVSKEVNSEREWFNNYNDEVMSFVVTCPESIDIILTTMQNE